ncbi:hypothetical protein JJB09_13385 [Rhizobium sp. KVB221]|uniref:Uncharacterized protein n=1 Tax=Rhizobium setariae TaxID=2801340 RepID=A0A936YQP3_9HYPH|nr:hypothetical protein [Rhizobium setariae]MBL0373022.1 hypothetical protein [Rhizobium setariae]
MIIDGAVNCTYEIFQATEEEFNLIFPLSSDLIFIEDLMAAKKNKSELDSIFKNIWNRPIDKKNAVGIHGTIFYEQYYKKEFFPNGTWDG